MQVRCDPSVVKPVTSNILPEACHIRRHIRTFHFVLESKPQRSPSSETLHYRSHPRTIPEPRVDLGVKAKAGRSSKATVDRPLDPCPCLASRRENKGLRIYPVATTDKLPKGDNPGMVTPVEADMAIGRR